MIIFGWFVSTIFWVVILVVVVVLSRILGFESAFKEKPARAFLFSLFSGTILLPSFIWWIWVNFQHLPPPLSRDGFLLLLSFVCSFLILVNSFFLMIQPKHHKKAGLMITASSLWYLAYLTPVGLFFSPLLIPVVSGLIGGYLAVTWLEPFIPEK
jgi:hypothetical protein